MIACEDCGAPFDAACGSRDCRPGRTWAAYIETVKDSPYGEALAAWDDNAETLRTQDAERLDECAQIARSHASVPANARFARTLAMFAQDCDHVRLARY